MTKDKKKSLKIRGVLDKFNLIGNLSLRPSKQPDSKIDIKMSG